MNITRENKGLTPDGKWIFKPDSWCYSQTGYEDCIDILSKYDCKDFKTKYTELEKEKIVDELFEVYRSKNIFPINYYSDYGAEQEILDVMRRDCTLEKDGKFLPNKYNNGLDLCKYLFPALHKTQRIDCDSMLNRFFNDKYLRVAIKLALEVNFSGKPTAVYGAMRLAGAAATNFKPISAKTLYEHFTPKGGLIHDSSCGFGGRLFGALSSYNNYKYIGTDPNTDIQDSLHKLGNLIESVSGREEAFKIFCIGSENFKLKGIKEIADFSFTSPPYFDCEIYSDEKTQSYNKYDKGIIQWLEGFMRPTMANTYNILKPGSYYALNVADFNRLGKTINYVDHCIRIGEQVGFKYQYKINMSVTTRIGSGFSREEGLKRDKEKSEGVYIFKKE